MRLGLVLGNAASGAVTGYQQMNAEFDRQQQRAEDQDLRQRRQQARDYDPGFQVGDVKGSADTTPSISIEDWAKRYGIDPSSLNGVAHPEGFAAIGAGKQLTPDYTPPAGIVGRPPASYPPQALPIGPSDVPASTSAPLAPQMVATPTGDPHKDAQGFFSSLVGKPVTITSAQRDAAHNAAVGGSPTSAHLTGNAWDITVPGMNGAQIVERLKAAGVPYDQLIDEGGNAHFGLPRESGGPMRQQVLVKTANGHYRITGQPDTAPTAAQPAQAAFQPQPQGQPVPQAQAQAGAAQQVPGDLWTPPAPPATADGYSFYKTPDGRWRATTSPTRYTAEDRQRAVADNYARLGLNDEADKIYQSLDRRAASAQVLDKGQLEMTRAHAAQAVGQATSLNQFQTIFDHALPNGQHAQVFQTDDGGVHVVTRDNSTGDALTTTHFNSPGELRAQLMAATADPEHFQNWWLEANKTAANVREANSRTAFTQAQTESTQRENRAGMPEAKVQQVVAGTQAASAQARVANAAASSTEQETAAGMPQARVAQVQSQAALGNISAQAAKAAATRDQQIYDEIHSAQQVAIDPHSTPEQKAAAQSALEVLRGQVGARYQDVQDGTTGLRRTLKINTDGTEEVFSPRLNQYVDMNAPLSKMEQDADFQSHAIDRRPYLDPATGTHKWGYFVNVPGARPGAFTSPAEAKSELARVTKTKATELGDGPKPTPQIGGVAVPTTAGVPWS